MIRFLAEIANSPNTSIQPTPAGDYTRDKNIYYLDISPYPKNTYWSDWNGTYDNFTDTQIELYYGEFLRKVDTVDEMLNTEFTLFITSDFIVLFNIPIHPWLYPRYAAKAFHVTPFLSSAINPDNPSNNKVRGVNASTRLAKPDINSKLSDNISGIILNQSFTITLSNSDGYFDNDVYWNLFNTPVYIKKSVVETPKYEDFKTIKYGLVENVTVDLDNFIIDVSDRLRAMDEPVCDLILRENLPLKIEVDEKSLNKNLPIVYGTKNIKLLQLNETMYLAAEYITEIHDVFNKDGEHIDYMHNRQTGIITILQTTDDEGKEIIPKADNALITGYANNNLGSIIHDIITRKTSIAGTSVNWNVDELKHYIKISPDVNVVIDSGNVKNAVSNLLKNDMAFLLQQTNGKFTIRCYGEMYTEHNISSWNITKKPDKTWSSAHNNYFSSCKINYGFIDKDNYLTLLYNEFENMAEDIYRRRVIKTFDTDLINKKDALALANKLTDRYLIMKQTLKLATGNDTSRYELMDIVVTDFLINDRLFSEAKRFMIKEADPAQDILLLEEMPQLA